jgi:transcriptional regulator of acetoin/glycerol metabolism
MGIDPRALRLILEHTWPGNDLELEGTLERAAATAPTVRLSVQDLANAGLRESNVEPEVTPDLSPASIDDESVPSSSRMVRRRRATRRRR